MPCDIFLSAWTWLVLAVCGLQLSDEWCRAQRRRKWRGRLLSEGLDGSCNQQPLRLAQKRGSFVWFFSQAGSRYLAACPCADTACFLVVFFLHLPRKMEPIEGSETSAFKPQTLGKYPKENILHKEHGESLKSSHLHLYGEETTSHIRLFEKLRIKKTRACFLVWLKLA